jgi:hypothetical protein
VGIWAGFAEMSMFAQRREMGLVYSNNTVRGLDIRKILIRAFSLSLKAMLT